MVEGERPPGQREFYAVLGAMIDQKEFFEALKAAAEETPPNMEKFKQIAMKHAWLSDDDANDLRRLIGSFCKRHWDDYDQEGGYSKPRC